MDWKTCSRASRRVAAKWPIPEMQQRPKLIAIVGGSGAGKTCLAHRLQQELSPAASCLSLDNFYLDRGSLPLKKRENVNYDHPRAIDWQQFEFVLCACRGGKCAFAPRYNFATHTRMFHAETFLPTPVVLVEGLWLLVRPRVRSLFDFSIYLDCPAQLRLERRLERDAIERGREPNTVREQFWKTVAPMHERFVEPQMPLADVVFRHALDIAAIKNLAKAIRDLAAEEKTRTAISSLNLPVITSARIATDTRSNYKHALLQQQG